MPICVGNTAKLLFNLKIETQRPNGFPINTPIQLVLEVNFSDPNEMKSMQGALIAKEPFHKNFTKEELQKFEEGLKSYGYQLSDVEKFSPMALYSMITAKYFDCAQSDMKMLDLELMQMAVKAKKTVVGLETIKEQMKTFESYLQPKDIVKMVEDYETSKNQFAEFQEYYVSENLEALAKMMKEGYQMTDEQKDILIDRRNKKWMEIFPELLAGDPVFIAVGAGHLAGENGVLNLLKKSGYKVEPVLK